MGCANVRSYVAIDTCDLPELYALSLGSVVFGLQA